MLLDSKKVRIQANHQVLETLFVLLYCSINNFIIHLQYSANKLTDHLYTPFHRKETSNQCLYALCSNNLTTFLKS